KSRDTASTEPVEEMPQVALVGDHAIFGQVAFAAQVTRKRLAPFGRVFGCSEPARFDFLAICHTRGGSCKTSVRPNFCEFSYERCLSLVKYRHEERRVRRALGRTRSRWVCYRRGWWLCGLGKVFQRWNDGCQAESLTYAACKESSSMSPTSLCRRCIPSGG